jgi:hypothetical protein
MQMNPAVTLFGERRRSPRTNAYFPVELHIDNGAPVTAMARDISRYGAQILTPKPIGLRTEVAVLMYPSDPESSRAATGRVVRIMKHREEGLWSWVVCVSFDDPVPAVESDAASTAARQRAIGW